MALFGKPRPVPPSLVGSVTGQLLPNSFVGLLRKQSLNQLGWLGFSSGGGRGTSPGQCSSGKARWTQTQEEYSWLETEVCVEDWYCRDTSDSKYTLGGLRELTWAGVLRIPCKGVLGICLCLMGHSWLKHHARAWCEEGFSAWQASKHLTSWNHAFPSCSPCAEVKWCMALPNLLGP